METLSERVTRVLDELDEVEKSHKQIHWYNFYSVGWDVKAHCPNMDVDNLLKRITEMGYFGKDDDVELFKKVYDELSKDRLEDICCDGYRQAQEDFTDKDNQCWQCIKDEEAEIEWTFIGRQGGYVCMVSFDGMKLGGHGFHSGCLRNCYDPEDNGITDTDSPYYERDVTELMDRAEKLLRFIAQYDKELTREKAVIQVEEYAAFRFYASHYEDALAEQKMEKEAEEFEEKYYAL